MTAQGGDRAHAVQTAYTADNDGTEKGASPKYIPLVPGAPMGNRADGEGRSAYGLRPPQEIRWDDNQKGRKP